MVGFLFTNLLTIIGTAAGWCNPIFGLMVYYMFATLRPQHLWFWNEWPVQRLSYALAISTLIGWGLSGFGNFKGLRGVGLPTLGLFLYLLGGTIGWLSSPLPGGGHAWEFLLNQYKIGLMVLVTLTLVREPRQIKTFAWVLTGSMGYLAWVFNSQYFFDGWNRIYLRGFGGIDNNGTAMIMVMGVPLAFFMGLHGRNNWVKMLCLLAALVQIHVILFSFSRGGQLGLCIVGFAIFYVALTRMPRKGRTLLMAAFALAFAIYFAGAEVRERFWTIFADPEERDTSAASRFDTWRGAWLCMLDHPLGVGPRNFNLVSNQYGLTRNKSVHNLFLQTGADYGFIGLFGLGLFYASTIWGTYRMAKSPAAKRLEWPHYYAHMICISLGGLVICSMFIGMESIETGYMVGTLGMCTIAFTARSSETQPTLATVPELAEVPTADEDFEAQPA